MDANHTHDCWFSYFRLVSTNLSDGTSQQGLILPDEISYITFIAFVDNDSASKLNLGLKELEATLILHTILGKDHFISVTGEYGGF
jgi:hypothetical protein